MSDQRLGEEHTASIFAAFGGAAVIISAFLAWAQFKYWPAFAGLGAVALAVGAHTIRSDNVRDRDLAKRGHQAGLHIVAGPGFCLIRTVNWRVAERLAQRHAQYVSFPE